MNDAISKNMPVRAVKKKPREHRVTLTVLCVLYFVYAATLIFPFLWLVYNSLKDKIEFSVNPWAMPVKPVQSLGNFAKIFSEFNLGSMFLNSIILSVAMPLINLFFCACTAYAYAAHDFKGKRALYWLAMVPMLVNITGTLPSQYNLFVKIGIFPARTTRRRR